MVVDTGRLVWLSVGFCCIGNDMVGVEVTVTGQDKVGVEATGDKVGVEATGYGKEIWVDAGSPILLPTDPEVMTSKKKMKKIIITLDIYLLSAHVHQVNLRFSRRYTRETQIVNAYRQTLHGNCMPVVCVTQLQNFKRMLPI